MLHWRLVNEMDAIDGLIQATWISPSSGDLVVVFVKPIFVGNETFQSEIFSLAGL